MSADTPVNYAAEAAARVFKGLPALRARPAERTDLPDAAQLQSAITPRWEFSEHYRRSLRSSSSLEGRKREQRLWLRGALGAFGVEQTYFVALGANGSPWWCVEPDDPVDWLATLACSQDDGTPKGHGSSPIRSRQGDGVEDLTVLSPDGARALLLQTWEDEILAFQMPTRLLVHRAVSGHMLLALVKELDPTANAVPTDARERLRQAVRGVRAYGFHADSSIRIEAAALRPGPRCRRRWSWDASAGERSRFFLEALAALDASGDAEPSVARRYWVSAGAFGPLTWTRMAAASPPPDWISTLWDRGHLNRLFVVAPTEDAVLGFLATATGIEGFLHDIDEVRSA